MINIQKDDLASHDDINHRLILNAFLAMLALVPKGMLYHVRILKAEPHNCSKLSIYSSSRAYFGVHMVTFFFFKLWMGNYSNPTPSNLTIRLICPGKTSSVHYLSVQGAIEGWNNIWMFKLVTTTSAGCEEYICHFAFFAFKCD